MTELIRVEELWDDILAQEEKQVRLPSISYVPILKKMLGKYKFTQLRQDPSIKEILGDFRLVYKIEKIKDSMSVILIIKRVIDDPNKLTVPGSVVK